MTLSRGLRRLADVVDELEASGVDVLDASLAPAGDDGADADTITATIELSLSLALDDDGGRGDATPDAGHGDDSLADDGPRNGAQTGDEGPDAGDEAAATTADDGAGGADAGPAVIECPEPDCDATFESEPGMKVHRTKVHLSAGDEETGDVPAYRDPDVLAEVYAAEDTFPEMRDALEADVSAQTVRRHMIKHGIHDPDANAEGPAGSAPASDGQSDGDASTAGDDASDTPDDASEGDAAAGGDGSSERDGTTGEAASDDPGLDDGDSLADAVPDDVAVPEGLTLGELRAGVDDADTLYDVQQRFELDRETARDLLSTFDLLELVHGRVATRTEREELKEEIDRRIRETIADGVSA